MKNTRGELVTDESEIREVWSSYFEKLLNEEFEWNRDFLKDWQEDESSTAESAELITEQEVKLAIKQMKKAKQLVHRGSQPKCCKRLEKQE